MKPLPKLRVTDTHGQNTTISITIAFPQIDPKMSEINCEHIQKAEIPCTVIELHLGSLMGDALRCELDAWSWVSCQNPP